MGGAEKMTVNIANILDKNIFDVSLLIIDNRFIDLIDNVEQSVNIQYLNIIRTRYAFFGILFEIFKQKPQIVFSSTNRTNLLVLMVKLVYPFFKVILREPSMPSLQIKNGNLSQTKHILIKTLYPLADIIIAQTDYMKDEIIKYFSLKKENVITIKNLLDKNIINSSIDDNIRLYDDKKVNFVCVGGLRKEKNQLKLVQVFSEIIKIKKNKILHLVGVGPLENDITNFIEHHNLTNNIFLHGMKANPYNYIKQADCLILPSIWEGMPNVVNEALYLTTPVISTNCTPILKDLIINYENGILIDSIDLDQLKMAILNHERIQKVFSEVDNDDYNKFITKILND